MGGPSLDTTVSSDVVGRGRGERGQWCRLWDVEGTLS